MSDKAIRFIKMLELIPRAPKRIGTAELVQRLSQLGFATTMRMVQRDLAEASRSFPIQSDEQVPAGWYWSHGAIPIQLPTPDPMAALTLAVAEPFLKKALPPAAFTTLGEHFRTAIKVLQATNGDATGWLDKFRVVHKVPALAAPVVDPVVQAAVYQGLFSGHLLDLEYQHRCEEPFQYPDVRPIGIVLREGVAYLVGMRIGVTKLADANRFALHRVLKAAVSPKQLPRGWRVDLDQYLEEEGIGFGMGKTIKLKLRLTKYAAHHFGEMPLSPDQTIKPDGDDHVILRATIRYSVELRWWLMSYEDRLEVLGPKELKRKMASKIFLMAKLYGEK